MKVVEVGDGVVHAEIEIVTVENIVGYLICACGHEVQTHTADNDFRGRAPGCRNRECSCTKSMPVGLTNKQRKFALPEGDPSKPETHPLNKSIELFFFRWLDAAECGDAFCDSRDVNAVYESGWARSAPGAGTGLYCPDHIEEHTPAPQALPAEELTPDERVARGLY